MPLAKSAVTATERSLIGRRLRVALGYAISLACIGWLIHITEWEALKTAFRTGNPVLVFFGATSIFLSFFALTARWQGLIAHKSEVGYRTAFHSLMFGHMLNVFLPLRAGDVFRINFIRKLPGWNAGRAVAVAVVERLADLLFLSVLSIALIGMVELPSSIEGSLMIIMISIAAFSLLSFLLTRYREPVCRCLSRLGELFSRSFGRFLENHAHQYLDATSMIFTQRDGGRMRYLHICATSLIGWTFYCTGVYFCLLAFGVPEPRVSALAVVIATNFGLAVPSSPGGFGVYHALVVLSLTPWNVPVDLSAAVALIAHAIVVGPLVVMGAGSLLLVKRDSN